ncbi:MAG: adenosylhomocysteine nucleosidase [Gammaproteobacteria bacterium]|jgi:adenosylhomocysteine nucleosidase
MRIGFVAALNDEARTLDVAPGNKAGAPARIVKISGPGPLNATAAADSLIDKNVDALVSWGTCGALDLGLQPGAVIVYESIVREDGFRYTCDGPWCDRLMEALASFKPHRLSGYCAARAIATGTEKKHVADLTDCSIVDMESAAVAACAHTAQLPFVTLRVVVDPVMFDIPSCALNALEHGGQPRTLPVIKGLLRRPQELPALLKLARWYRDSLDMLRLCAVALEPDFGTE